MPCARTPPQNAERRRAVTASSRLPTRPTPEEEIDQQRDVIFITDIRRKFDVDVSRRALRSAYRVDAYRRAFGNRRRDMLTRHRSAALMRRLSDDYD